MILELTGSSDKSTRINGDGAREMFSFTVSLPLAYTTFCIRYKSAK